MSGPTLAPTESQAFTALRGFLMAAVPGIAVVQGESNRVAEPGAPDFVVMTSLMRERLSTNVNTWAAVAVPPALNQLAPTKLTVQLDVHGPASGDNSQIIATLLRDDYAVQSFAASGFDVRPLYSGDPRQSPFVDGEEQYENRWSIDAVLQVNAVVAVPQTFADTLTPRVESPVDAYPH